MNFVHYFVKNFNTFNFLGWTLTDSANYCIFSFVLHLGIIWNVYLFLDKDLSIFLFLHVHMQIHESTHAHMDIRSRVYMFIGA